MFQPSHGNHEGVQLTLINSKVTRCKLITSGDLAVDTCQPYNLKATVRGMKHVAVI